MKKYLIITAVLMSSLSAHAQNLFQDYQAFLDSPSHSKSQTKVSTTQTKPDDIFKLVKQDDGKKITELLKDFPEAASLQESGWYPAQFSVWFKKTNAAKAIITFLKDNDMLDQLKERKPEGQDEGAEGSAYDLGGQFIDQILKELTQQK